MKLRSEQEIAGRPARQVRALLRRFNQEFWTVRKAANALKIPEEQARRLVYWLRRLGFVEVVRQQRPGTWRNTMAGNALANATALPPLSRTNADRLLKEFLARVGIVNEDPSWLYRVGKVVIFGSFLNSQDWIGDIDLAIRLDRRPEFAEQWPEALLARADAAESRGRRFRGFLDRLAWPETEVRRYLRGGVRWLSLHDWTKGSIGFSTRPTQFSSMRKHLERRRSPPLRNTVWDPKRSIRVLGDHQSELAAALSDCAPSSSQLQSGFVVDMSQLCRFFRHGDKSSE